MNSASVERLLNCVPKAHIDITRWLASLAHVALLVLQADSAESSEDCACAPEAHISITRWTASFAHAALLVLQADSAKSSDDCAWLVLLPRDTCSLQAALFVHADFKAASASVGPSERSLICLQRGSANPNRTVVMLEVQHVLAIHIQ